MGIGYDNDDYPFEGHIRNQPPPFMGDDNGYVLKNQRVVQFVRPVVTRHVYVNGKPVKEERIVGDYQLHNYGSGHNNYYADNALKDSLDNLGIINGFLGQVQTEASMSPRDGAAAFLARRPASAAAAVESKPNWGSRAAWVAAPADDSFSRYTEYPDQTENHYHPSSVLTGPNWGSYSNTSWPNKRQASPSRSAVYSRQSMLDSDAKSNNGSFKDNSPTGYGERSEARNLYRPDSESNKSNWGSRPNWPNSRRASPPPPRSPAHSKQGTTSSDNTMPDRVFQDNPPTRYGDHFEPSRRTHHFVGEEQRQQDSPPLKQLERLDIKDNNSQGSSPTQNTRSGSTEVVKNENIEAQNLYRLGSESNNPNLGARPNWPNSRHASPPGSPMHSRQGTISSDSTKPNFQDNFPTPYGDRFEPSRPTHHFEGEEQRQQDNPPIKQLERLGTKNNNSQGSSPNQNMMDAYMARSGSTQVVKNGNGDSLVKDNALQVKDSKNQMGNLDDGSNSTKESSSEMATKPRFFGGWYKPSRGTQGGGSSGTTTTKHWSEITPNPPVGPMTIPPLVESREAMRRYAYVKPTMATGYYGAITSEDAVRKYGGFFVPPS
ncbi:unnamed protein product [Cuscuta campestris]|uniref:Uncharacterized protein n=1 Tax=Cuscuta campestris TaxID=132261 RepID=A0A484L2D0_9ASTE|nr:unnamed protein product [Cuscuta campestris]